MAGDATAGIGNLANTLFEILVKNPPIALVAIAFAVLIVFTATLIHKANPIGKVIGSAFLGLCLFILAMGTFVFFSPKSAPQHIASLQVRLDNKTLPDDLKTTGDSRICAASRTMPIRVAGRMKCC